MVASAADAVSSCIISIPQEVIKQHLVTGVYPSFRNALSTIYSTEGILGFYNSWKLTLARNVPFVMVTFVAKDILTNCRLKKAKDGKNQISLLVCSMLFLRL
ncbi:MC/SLC25 family protein [uncultured Marinobacter sp.]|uniref:MC/SLC25 family protein n=1 Tax=uncultured Marinobacter sp. TaxID=187379 RepID=UPI00338D9E23